MNSADETFFISRIKEDFISEVMAIQTDCGLCGWTREDYQSEIKRGDSTALVLSNSKELAGFIIIRPTAAGEAEIYNFGIRAKYRGKGFGSKLLRSAIKKLTANGTLRELWLEVRESNLNAIYFYRRQGFVVAGSRKNFYQNPAENALLMKLEIPRSEPQLKS